MFYFILFSLYLYGQHLSLSLTVLTDCIAHATLFIFLGGGITWNCIATLFELWYRLELWFQLDSWTLYWLLFYYCRVTLLIRQLFYFPKVISLQDYFSTLLSFYSLTVISIWFYFNLLFWIIYSFCGFSL